MNAYTVFDQKKSRFSFLLFAVLFLSYSATTFAQLKDESSAGLVLTTGNTQTLSVNLKQNTDYQWDKNIVKVFGDFLTSSNDGIESSDKWDVGTRYERELNDHFNAFIGQRVEGDKFQDILQRYSSDIGGKYYIQKLPRWKWFTELGYRFSREDYFVGFNNYSFVRIFNEVERYFTNTVSVRWWVEFLPNVTQVAAYQLNTEVSVNAMITDIFSIKSGYLLKFNNSPPPGTAFRADNTVTTALVAKF